MVERDAEIVSGGQLVDVLQKRAIVVVGPSAQIAPRIEALQFGRIELRDAEGEARKAVSAAAQ